MAKTDNLKDFLTDVANAIRAKKGTTALINPQNFSSEIASIETGGSGTDTPIYYDTPYTFIVYDELNIPQSWRFVFREDGVVTLTTTWNGQPEYIETADGTYTITNDVLSMTFPAGTIDEVETILNFTIVSKNELIGQGDFEGWTLIANSIISVTITKNGNYSADNYLVKGFSEVTVDTVNIAQERIDETNSCDYLLYNYKGTNQYIVTALDTKNATSMVSMFAGCSNLTNLDVRNLDTSKVTDMTSMFENCTSLEDLTYYDSLNTANVTSMANMFKNCSSLTLVQITYNDLMNVTNMQSMFSGCTNLSNMSFGNNNINNNPTNTSYMFANCTNLMHISDLNMINVSTEPIDMFLNCTSLIDISIRNIKPSLNLSDTRLLLDYSTEITIFLELWDYSSETTTHTLTVSADTKAVMDREYVKLITPTNEQIAADPYINNKMPAEWCQFSDEGAMTLTAYVKLKNWTIAVN